MRGFITDPAGRAGLRLSADLPEPAPKPDEALVEVRAYAVNNDEATLIARRPDGWRPGQDAAGVVVRAAADGSGPAEGTRVACYLDAEGWAERVAVPTHCLAELADAVSFEQAAALPIAGLTALRALRVGGAVLGRQVLVTGATGGVGQFAVQLAVAAGATVTALVSGPERVADAAALGAHRVVTSLEDDSLGPFHLVLEGVGGNVLAAAVRHVVPGGHVAWFGNPGRRTTEISLADFYTQGWNAHIVGFISPHPEETKGEDLAILAGLVADGRLKPHIGLVLDWERTPEVFEQLAARAFRGKAVLTVAAPPVLPAPPTPTKTAEHARQTHGSHEGIWLRFLSGPDIEGLGIGQAEIIDAVERVVAAHGRGETVFEPRTHLVPDNGGVGHFNVLRGHVSTLGDGGVSGVKVVGDFVPNFRLGLPSELALLTLYDPGNGTPRAIIDATFITEARTGAMTAVGARHLARPDAKVLGHVGARGTAFSNVTMLDTLFDLDEIRVTSRRPESRQAFAERLRTAIDTPVRVVDSAAEALEGADILVEATRLTEPSPLLHPGLVRAGAFVVPYGTVSAVSEDLLDVMDKVVVDDWREAQSGRFGALRHHVDSGKLSAKTLYAELGAVVSGQKPGRETAEERILLWHRGLSILDVAVGQLILERAQQAEVGTMLRYH